MKPWILASVLFITMVIAAGSAAADSSVGYPDGSSSVVVNLDVGSNAFVFLDNPGDGDIFVHGADAYGFFEPFTLGGLPAGVAYWLDLRGYSGRYLVYDVYLNAGFGFFFVTQFLL